MSMLVRLWQGDARHHGRRLVTLGVGTLLATALCVLLGGLGLGLRQGVLHVWGATSEDARVEVHAPSLQLGPLALNLGGLLGGPALDADRIETLVHLPHVRALYPVIDVPLAMMAEGGEALVGHPIRADLLMTALDERAVPLPTFADDPGGAVPVLVHPALIGLFNQAVATTLGLGRIAPEAVVGLQFDIVMGQSHVTRPAPGARAGRVRARVVGLSPWALPLGVTVPLTTGRRLWADFGAPGGPEAPLRAVWLVPDGPEAVPAINRDVAALGLEVDAGAQRLEQMLWAVGVGLVLFGALILALAGLGVAQGFGAYIAARHTEVVLLRHVGASPRAVLGWMLGEAAAVGLGAGAGGAALGVGLATWVPRWAAPYLASVPLLPEPLCVTPWPLWAGSIACAVATAVMAASVSVVPAAYGPLGPHPDAH